MIQKIITILECAGAILISAALTLWSGNYWETANKLWWAGLITVTPVIAWKAWPQSFLRQVFIAILFCAFLRQVFIAILFCALLVIGKWWFGKKDIKVNIPYLPEITINRN